MVYTIFKNFHWFSIYSCKHSAMHKCWEVAGTLEQCTSRHHADWARAAHQKTSAWTPQLPRESIAGPCCDNTRQEVLDSLGYQMAEVDRMLSAAFSCVHDGSGIARARHLNIYWNNLKHIESMEILSSKLQALSLNKTKPLENPRRGATRSTRTSYQGAILSLLKWSEMRVTHVHLRVPFLALMDSPI